MLPKPAFRFVATVDLDSVAASLAPRLLAYALGRTGCRATAEDVAQESLAALVRRWRMAGPPESPEAFAFAITKRRAGRANARRALFSPLETIRELSQSSPGVEKRYEDRSELDAVLDGIRKLRKADREALLLRIAGELEITDIAAITGSTPAAVKMRIHRARKRLADLLPEVSYGRRKQTA